MTDIQVYLGGEGTNELGSRAREATYQDDSEPGLIAALLRRVEPTGWGIRGATQWKCIRKFRARGPVLAEEQNVLGLVLEAHRAGAQVVAFVRDADDDDGRTNTIEIAIRKAQVEFANIDVIGGVAVPVLEGWVLAMLGEHGTEDLSKAGAQSKLAKLGIDKDTAKMVRIADELLFTRLPRDATSLNTWIARAKDVLPRRVHACSRAGDE